MTLIVDTCNVLHRTGILPPELAGVDEEGLAALVGRSRYRDRPALLVCDGGPGGRAGGRGRGHVRYHYAGLKSSADEVIARLIEASNAPKRLLVVTSDRAVATMARRRRCRVVDADTFLGQLAHDIAREGPTRPPGRPQAGPLEGREVEAWLDQFELEEDLRSLAPSELPKPEPEPSAEPPNAARPPESDEPWENLSTEELLRRFERDDDAKPDRT